jgi:thiamine biosynthesis lipoprotein
MRPGMRLDLGAIAKGYATDEALAVLRRLGLPRALVNASGGISAGAPPPGRDGWRVAVAPLEPDAPPSQFLRVVNGAVATSGDTWQFVEIDGKRYSHIIDPRTGWGLTTHSSVTVLAPDGMTADGLATAVSVLGPQEGLALVEQTPGVAALIVLAGQNGRRVYESRRLADFRWPPNTTAGGGRH